MVSLGNESSRSGGYFFDGIDHSVGSHTSDDLLLDNPSLITELEPQYRCIRTTWLIAIQILLVVILEVVAFIDPLMCHGHSCRITGFEAIVYSHALLWFILLVIDWFLNYLHNRSRMAGYLEFYRQTKSLSRLPLLVNSFASVVLLVVCTVMLRYCTQGHTCGSISAINVLQILISVEVAVILPCLVVYLFKTLKFNRVCALPDVQRDEMATSFTHARSISTEIGFKDDDYLDQVLEKQADMIRYLKQHSAFLAKRVLALTSQVNSIKATE